MNGILFNYRLISFSLLFLSFANASAIADTTVFKSGPGQTVLIELFTSEGCSSCPPADEWMSTFKNSPDVWKIFVPVAFHVDYWNYLGWNDAMSLAQFSERQRNYASRWRLPSVYTPMIVNNGKESKEWYQTPTLSIKGKKDAGVLKIEKKNEEEFEVEFSPPNNIFTGRVWVNAAYLGNDMVYHVERGENQGRTLRHDFTVLSFQKKELVYQEGILKSTIQFDLKNSSSAPHHAIAAWVTREDYTEPLQAVGGVLD